MKHIRQRQDGRWEYRITKNCKTTSIYAKTQKQLLSKIKKLKQADNQQLVVIDKTFIYLARTWYQKFKQGIKSANIYHLYIEKYFIVELFNKNIGDIQYSELQDFLLSVSNKNRVADYCYLIIKGVYEYAIKLDYIKKDLSKIIDKPKNRTIKGRPFKIKEQRLILENLDKTPIANEILFYILVGCRREEALFVTEEDIDYEKLTVFIDGTKTGNAKRTVPISKAFAEILKKNFSAMFKMKKRYYTDKFREYLELLNLKGKLHWLRHSYSTNLYYLGVPDKQRQYYLGHGSIVITNDIYTTLDPSITKEDVVNLYNKLYPEF